MSSYIRLLAVLMIAVLLVGICIWGTTSVLFPEPDLPFQRPSEQQRLLDVQRILSEEIAWMERTLQAIETGRWKPDSDAYTDDLRVRIAERKATLAKLQERFDDLRKPR